MVPKECVAQEESMSKDGLFGKEFGLIQEVLETGRKIGAGWTFWEALTSPLLCRELSAFVNETDPEAVRKEHGWLEEFFPTGEDCRPEAFYSFSTLCSAVATAAQNGVGKAEWAKLAHSVVLFRAAIRYVHTSHPYGVTFPVPYNAEPRFHDAVSPDKEMLKSARMGIGGVRAALFPVTNSYSALRDIENCMMKPYGYQPADAYELAAFARVTLHSARPWSIVNTNKVIATGTSMWRPNFDGDTMHFYCIDPFQCRPALYRTLILGGHERHQYREGHLNVGDFVLGVQRI